MSVSDGGWVVDSVRRWLGSRQCQVVAGQWTASDGGWVVNAVRRWLGGERCQTAGQWTVSDGGWVVYARCLSGLTVTSVPYRRLLGERGRGSSRPSVSVCTQLLLVSTRLSRPRRCSASLTARYCGAATAATRPRSVSHASPTHRPRSVRSSGPTTINICVTNSSVERRRARRALDSAAASRPAPRRIVTLMPRRRRFRRVAGSGRRRCHHWAAFFGCHVN